MNFKDLKLKEHTKFRFCSNGKVYSYNGYKLDNYDYWNSHDSHYDYTNYSATLYIYTLEQKRPLTLEISTDKYGESNPSKKEIKEVIKAYFPEVYIGRKYIPTKLTLQTACNHLIYMVEKAILMTNTFDVIEIQKFREIKAYLDGIIKEER